MVCILAFTITCLKCAAFLLRYHCRLLNRVLMCFSCDFDKVLAWCVRAREGYWMGAKVVGPGPWCQVESGEWRYVP